VVAATSSGPAPAATDMNHFISTYGYWAVFLLVAVESLGVPLPGETAVVLAGVAAGQSHRLSPWIIFLVASAAAIIGDNIGYTIGRVGGFRLARRYGHWVRLDERKLKAGRYIFDRRGSEVVFFGRFVSVLRTYAAVLAGTNLMRWPKFLLFNAMGGIVWAAFYTGISYAAGKAFERVSGTVSLILVGVAVVVVVLVIVLTHRSIARVADKAEAAYPGPL
jgi:membrane protein DedA with SNARE-associated domain